MIISKSNKYYRDKIRIDKAHNQKTSWKIKTYQNQLIDNYIKSYNEGVPVKPSPATIYGELAILNKPDVYNNYQKIINSKYTSDEAINNMLIKNKANKDLDRIVSAEVERIAKNIDWVEQVIHKYEVPLKEYNKVLSEQASKSMANRQQILKDVAIKSNELLVSEGLNIPSNVFSYRDIEVSAESMLRQSQMTSNHELHQEINENYLADGKEAPYKSKRWVWTGAGETTRHESNNMQEVAFNDYFVVVNDKTLDIDMLMYPSDPDGSPSNVYICYCEVEYGNEEYVPPEYDMPSLQWTPQPATPEVSFGNIATLGGTKIFEPKGEFIDTSKLVELQNGNYNVGKYDGVEYDTLAGDYYLNGLKVKEYDAGLDWGEIDPQELAEHNKKYIENPSDVELVTKSNVEPIETDDLFLTSDGEYMVGKSDGVVLNALTGKYELNGLELEFWSKTVNKGLIKKELVDEHNSQFHTEIPATAEPINTAELLDAYDGKNYIVDDADPNIKYDAMQDQYLYKDIPLEVGEDGLLLDKEAINEYNESLTEITNEPTKEQITQADIDEGLYHSYNDTVTLFDFQDGLVELESKAYFKGLDITQYYDFSKGWASIPKSVIDNYNNGLLAEQTAPVNAPTVTESSKPKQKLELREGITEGTDKYYNIDGNIADVVYNTTTGKYEYHGFELKYYNEETHTGKLSKKEIEKHNEQYEPATSNDAKAIDTDILFKDSDGDFQIDIVKHPELQDHIKFNYDTQNFEYDGLKIHGSNFKNTGFGWLEGKEVAEHNAKANAEITPTVPKKKFINTNEELIYSSEDGGYLVETFKLDKVGNDYYFNGLKVDVANDTYTYQIIPEENVKKHNEQFNTPTNNTTIQDSDFKPIVETKDYYIHGKDSKVLDWGEDIDGQVYAVDKNGRQWVMDKDAKYEKAQDHLQNQVDMSSEYNSVEHWGGGGYRKINHFNYLKKTFGDAKYKVLYDEVIPILNDIRKGLDKGRSVERLEDKYNKTIKKFKESGNFSRYDDVWKVINEIKDIDRAMVKAPALQQDTCFIRAGAWKLEFNKIGEVFEWEGFAGTSYRDRPVNLGHESLSYNITMLAPKGTRGVRLSEQFDALTNEREWLLPRGQKFRVLEFDAQAHTCTIELIVEDF